MDDELSPEEEAIYTALATRAGVIAQRILSEDGVAYLDDLGPEAAREVLRAAWREAAAERFQAEDLAALTVEINAMIDSLVMDLSSPAARRPRLH